MKVIARLNQKKANELGLELKAIEEYKRTALYCIDHKDLEKLKISKQKINMTSVPDLAEKFKTYPEDIRMTIKSYDFNTKKIQGRIFMVNTELNKFKKIHVLRKKSGIKSSFLKKLKIEMIIEMYELI